MREPESSKYEANLDSRVRGNECAREGATSAR